MPVNARLWSGLLAMLTLVMHPMLAPMSGREFSGFLHAFLPVARHAWFNYVAIIGMIISPVLALVVLRNDTASAPFVLTAIGLALTITGPLIVSDRLAEPNYDVLLGWNPDSVPADWKAGRHRYFALDWIRAGATWTAFATFLVALVAAD